MKLRNLRVERQPRLMIIPMIDIIFFLLVFFMMSTLYMMEQKVLPVNLPQAATVQVDTSKPLVITVNVDGQISIDLEKIPLELLRSRIKVELARNPQTTFVLRADRKAEYGQVVMVLDELKSLGVSRIAVAAEAKAR